MDCKILTGMVNLHYRAVLRLCAEWYVTYAMEQHIAKGIVGESIETYAMASVRIIPDDKRHSKLFAVPGDEPDAVKTKFLKYLDLPVALTNQWVRVMNQMDQPSDPALAPTVEITEDLEKNG